MIIDERENPRKLLIQNSSKGWISSEILRIKKEKLQYANKHIAVRKNYNFPYVGIIQIRLWVKAIQLTLSLLTQAPLVLIAHIVTLWYEKVNNNFYFTGLSSDGLKCSWMTLLSGFTIIISIPFSAALEANSRGALLSVIRIFKSDNFNELHNEFTFHLE